MCGVSCTCDEMVQGPRGYAMIAYLCVQLRTDECLHACCSVGQTSPEHPDESTIDARCLFLAGVALGLCALLGGGLCLRPWFCLGLDMLRGGVLSRTALQAQLSPFPGLGCLYLQFSPNRHPSGVFQFLHNPEGWPFPGLEFRVLVLPLPPPLPLPGVFPFPGSFGGESAA